MTKKKTKKKRSQTARRFICTSILPSTTTGGALYGDCNPSCTRLTALQCSPEVLASKESWLSTPDSWFPTPCHSLDKCYLRLFYVGKCPLELISV